jgi:hypothetical protein
VEKTQAEGLKNFPEKNSCRSERQEILLFEQRKVALAKIGRRPKPPPNVFNRICQWL